MTDDMKQEIMNVIEENVDIFYKVNKIQYRIRCPICGDSNKNPKDAHCYIKCSNDPSEPLLYHCFLANCNAKGIVNGRFLRKIGIRSRDIITKVDSMDNAVYNRIPSLKEADINIILGNPDLQSPQANYIESRLGTRFTIDDYNKFNIVWDMKLIYPYISDNRVKNTLPSNNDSVSFISSDKSLMLTRYFSDDGSRWRKIKLFKSDSKSFYTIKIPIDIFTKDNITVNIAEGIIDVISIYKNFNDPNAVYISTIGSDYVGGIEYAIAKGLIGNNVTIKLYIDSDIDESILKRRIKRFKWLFNNIYICKNIKQKDVGVKINDIKLITIRV